jgi:hypothetical protein
MSAPEEHIVNLIRKKDHKRLLTRTFTDAAEAKAHRDMWQERYPQHEVSYMTWCPLIDIRKP